MNPDLKTLQRRLAAAVMTPLTRRDTLSRRAGATRSGAALVRPNDRLTSFERLEIYNRQYWFRLLDSLGEDFPGLRGILGPARFHRLAQAYLADCPSTSFTLRNLGARLGRWLARHSRWAGPFPALALDMVRLEWAHLEAFDLAERPTPGPEDLAGVDADTRFGLQPHLRLLRLDHPVDDLAVALRALAEQTMDAAAAARRRRLVRAAAAARATIHLAVHRHDHTVYYKRLAPEEHALLRALGAGAGLGEAIAAGFQASAMPEAERADFIRQAFQRWAACGWLVAPGIVQPHSRSPHEHED